MACTPNGSEQSRSALTPTATTGTDRGYPPTLIDGLLAAGQCAVCRVWHGKGRQGTVALFWNYHVVPEDLRVEFDAVYDALAPELTVVGRNPAGAPDTDPFDGDVHFCSFGSKTHRWPRVLEAHEWTSMLTTFSDHAQLCQPRLRELQRALRLVIGRTGGTVRSQCGTYVWAARRTDTR